MLGGLSSPARAAAGRPPCADPPLYEALFQRELLRRLCYRYFETQTD